MGAIFSFLKGAKTEDASDTHDASTTADTPRADDDPITDDSSSSLKAVSLPLYPCKDCISFPLVTLQNLWTSYLDGEGFPLSSEDFTAIYHTAIPKFAAELKQHVGTIPSALDVQEKVPKGDSFAMTKGSEVTMMMSCYECKTCKATFLLKQDIQGFVEELGEESALNDREDKLREAYMMLFSANYASSNIRACETYIFFDVAVMIDTDFPNPREEKKSRIPVLELKKLLSLPEGGSTVMTIIEPGKAPEQRVMADS